MSSTEQGFVGSPSLSLPVLVLGVVVLYYVTKYGALLVAWIRRVNLCMKALSHFPGPKRHWLYGNLHMVSGFNEGFIKWIRGYIKKHPRGVVIWLGPFRPILSTCHPETCKLILRSTEPKQLSGTGGYSFTRPWLGDGLLLSSGKKWLRNRRLLTPGFHFDVLKPYMNIYTQSADILLDKFAEGCAGGTSLDVFKPVSLCTLDVILKCAFSSNMDVQRQGDSHPYANAVIQIARLILQRAMNPLLYPNVIYKLCPSGREFFRYLNLAHRVSTDVINKRKIALKDNPDFIKKRYPDFLDILLMAKDDDGKGLTDIEIRDEVDTFLFEGHDTTASAISWILYTLAEHPEHQEKCYQEISRIFDGRDKPEMQWEDLSELSYTTLCIKEAMRLHSPVPLIGREVEDEFEIDGVKLPPGTLMDVNIHELHHNEAVWGEDHDVFRPDRFELDNMAKMDSFAFVPFSAGPRNCIGQNFAMHEIKVVVAKAVHRFQLSTDPLYPALHLLEIVMRAEKGLHIFFTERKRSQ